MKRLQSIFLNGCAYTVLISVLILAITTLMSETGNLGISFTRYLIFIVCGFAVALANLIFEMRAVPFYARSLLHYVALLVAFLIIFTTDGVLSMNRISDFFVAIIIFTILYIVVFVITYFTKKAFIKLESKAQKGVDRSKQPSQKYESKFK